MNRSTFRGVMLDCAGHKPSARPEPEIVIRDTLPGVLVSIPEGTDPDDLRAVLAAIVAQYEARR